MAEKRKLTNIERFGAPSRVSTQNATASKINSPVSLAMRMKSKSDFLFFHFLFTLYVVFFFFAFCWRWLILSNHSVLIFFAAFFSLFHYTSFRFQCHAWIALCFSILFADFLLLSTSFPFSSRKIIF